jgi:hypothetical protein
MDAEPLEPLMGCPDNSQVQVRNAAGDSEINGGNESWSTGDYSAEGAIFGTKDSGTACKESGSKLGVLGTTRIIRGRYGGTVFEKEIQSGCDPNMLLEDRPRIPMVPRANPRESARIQCGSIDTNPRADSLGSRGERRVHTEGKWEIRSADWTRWMRGALCHLTMNGLVAQQDAVMMDV